MKHSILTLSTFGLLLGSTAALAGGHSHPETGEKLAEDQTFSYRLLDDVPTLDPQLIEDVSGSHVARQLFEGLLNQVVGFIILVGFDGKLRVLHVFFSFINFDVPFFCPFVPLAFMPEQAHAFKIVDTRL